MNYRSSRKNKRPDGRERITRDGKTCLLKILLPLVSQPCRKTKAKGLNGRGKLRPSPCPVGSGSQHSPCPQEVYSSHWRAWGGGWGSSLEGGILSPTCTLPSAPQRSVVSGGAHPRAGWSVSWVGRQVDRSGFSPEGRGEGWMLAVTPTRAASQEPLGSC